MKTTYDAETVALYLRLAAAAVVASGEVAPGIVLDFDADHRVVGVEVLNARQTLANGALPLAAAE
jgi:uncharacterized protein YuzE